MTAQDFLKNLLKFCIPTIVSAAVGILVLPLISRIYSESEYGYISNFYSVGNLISGLVFLGLDHAYIRFYNDPLPDATRNGQYMFTMLTGISVTLVFFLPVLLFGHGQMSGLLFNEVSDRGCILLCIYVIELVIYRLTNINYRFSNMAGAYNAQQVGFIISNRLLFALAVLYSDSYIYSVLVMVISMLAIVAGSLFHQRTKFSDVRISSSAKRAMLRFGLPLMPAGVIVLLNNSLAKLVLGGYGLRTEVGVLAIATSAANVFSIIPSAFTIYWGAFMYKYYLDEQEKIKRVHDLIMLVSAALVMGIVLMQDVLYKFLGENYRSSQPYFLLIMLTPISTLLLETTAYGISLKKKTHYTLVISILGCVVNALVCFLLIPRMGVYGAAAGIAASATINFVARTVVGQRLYLSIVSSRRTVLGCVIIWGLCIGNVVFSSNMFARIAAVLVTAVAIVVLYWQSIQYALRLIPDLLTTWRRR